MRERDVLEPTNSDTLAGTRFLVYPQAPFVAGYERPETVWISTPLGQVGAGPSDRRMYVADPLVPKAPYSFPFLPPLTGDLNPPAEPGPDGHFDHLAWNSREFLAAHSFACIRRVLDICESYIGREIPWFFGSMYERLEIIPYLPWDNAQSGFGFVELGVDETQADPFPFALNFDVIAHEAGHLVLLGALGPPQAPSGDNDFYAYHEAVADFVALTGLMHFDTALDRLLRRSQGNLFIMNELDQLGELMDERSIRTASHSLKLADVSRDVHDRSRPLLGALFDTVLEIYNQILFERGLAHLDAGRFDYIRTDIDPATLESVLAAQRDDYRYEYASRHFAFKSALAEARDIVGEALAGSWPRLDPDGLTLSSASAALLSSMTAGRGVRFTECLRTNLAWRGILQ